MGVLAALFQRAQTGEGQIVDAAIVDGVTSLMSFFAGLVPSGAISLEPGQNWIGGGAPFYRCYRCADGRDIARSEEHTSELQSLMRRSYAVFVLQKNNT